MKPVDADVFFASTLLGFDQPCGPVDTHDQTSRDFRVQGTRVTRFFDS